MMISGSEDGSIGPLREALTICAASTMSGVLRITGDPGGTIHLADGLVTAIETTGAPGPEVLLLRSQRITEPGWDAAFSTAAAAGHPMAGELVARKLIGAGELEALLRVALADAMFVLARGTVEEYRAEPGPPDAGLSLDPGVEADGLLAEATRRIRVIASLSLPVRYARERVAAVPGMARRGVTLGDGQDEILALADGRRTPRDMAFTLGRGVYATTLQLARMREAGLLMSSAQLASATAARQPGHLAGTEPEGPDALPRRGRARLSLPRRGSPSARQPDIRTARGLLWPRSGRDPGDAQTP